MNPSTIQVTIESRIATITLNRPEKRNAISNEMRLELITALEEVSRDRQVRAVVLTGNGKGFCAGGDVSGMAERMQAPAGEIAFNGWSRQQLVHHTVNLLYSMPKPTIAAVNGAAAGLGADMALSCDFVIASEEASFAWSYIKRGLIPDGGGMYFLPRRVGLARAKELVFSGRKVDATEALQLGIADRLSAPAALLGDAHAWAAELSVGSPTALALGKSILNQSYELSAPQVFAQGSQAQAVCYTSGEHRDAVLAFLNKSK
ncbi:enoyl-CoA hydratase/isomerase family protein [Paraburkholderia domus]|uniref:Short-chain-enoyl-CoA hydratase n=1 Tax=Paraburkholderia domus TaxID=2793075 RepID=A0A9N8MT10_9BURK|nr:enoyl-CoA hydratase/isomerase family protein [Paraburkholderia domus]MBK5060858.1 enoyl-CoA hydratase/isomerase family protein [Burkholderia sp. R-70199]MBK5120546.1 enoyl-CoA hydratase/isomerase family protein [Burkholderia sp. R-69980]MBK5166057.1 enoyl-CoA hydratase/isomerase family protein [Burkholderia sp. R-70211]MBK5180614.1 enoyl-CoA hydratase/isomerase family protein [Burkholderia sp. R-69749]MCI0146221.1 enoyl-CoA hydratase/isomerase family protein [Paraburkholderia sediminicola]